MASPIQFTLMLFDTTQTPPAPLAAGTNVTVTNMDGSNPATGSPARMFADMSGSATGSNTVTVDSSRNITCFLDPAGVDNTSRYKFTPAGLPLQALPVQPRDLSLIHHQYLWLDPTKPPYNADPTGVAEASTAINNCESDAATTGKGLIWPVGVFKCNAAAIIKHSNVPWVGPGTGIVDGSSDRTKGAWLLRSASISAPVVNATGVEFCYISGVNIDASASTDTGILYTSTNSPPSHDFHFTHGTIVTQGDGIVNGSGGSEQCDQLHIKDGVRIYANRCIVINSANAADGGSLGPGLSCFPIYGTNPRGIAILKGGYTTIDRVVFGGGNIAGTIFIDVTGSHGPLRILQTEGEDGLTSTLHFRLASTAPPDYTNQICIEGNATALGWDFQQTAIVSSRGNSFYTVNPKLSGTAVLVYTDGSDTFVTPATGWNVTGAGSSIGPPRMVGTYKGTWSPGAIAAGATVSTAVSVGCVPGDFVQASLDTIPNTTPILEIDAEPAAANVVTVNLTNKSGSTVTPASGNLRVMVTRGWV